MDKMFKFRLGEEILLNEKDKEDIFTATKVGHVYSVEWEEKGETHERLYTEEQVQEALNMGYWVKVE